MPYDAELDKTLKKWKCDETGLISPHIVEKRRFGSGAC